MGSTGTAFTHELQANTAGPVLALAVEPVPGLRIYRQPLEFQRPGDLYTWRLGHHSGFVIADFETPAQAQIGARLVAHLTDWTRSAEDLRTDPTVPVQDIADTLYFGRFHSKNGITPNPVKEN